MKDAINELLKFGLAAARGTHRGGPAQSRDSLGAPHRLNFPPNMA